MREYGDELFIYAMSLLEDMAVDEAKEEGSPDKKEDEAT